MPLSLRLTSYWSALRSWVRIHKIWTAVLVLAILFAGYFAYTKLTSTSGQVRYVLGYVASSTIIASVSGSGQVSPSNQIDIKPKQSGQVTGVLVHQGDTVREGQALAYIDATNALKAVRDAKANLQSAEISLAKLKEPPTALTLTQAQNALSNAQEALAKLYNDSQTDVVNAFLDLPEIITGLEGVVTDTNTNSNTQWNIDFYENATIQYDSRAKSYRDTAYNDYIAAKHSYDIAFQEYQALGSAPDTATIEKMLQETYVAVSLAAKATKSINAFVQFYVDTINNHNQTPSSVATAALTSLNTYTGTLNTNQSALLTDTSELKSDKQTITEKQQSLAQTNAGTDALDLQSAQLNVTKAQNALTDSENTLSEYTIRAPFAGTIAKVDIKKGDQASSGTSAATIITKDQLADLSLNEVDAAKVKVGQKVTLTFDAIDGLSIAGEVASVDTLGTVTQGVVSYDVKIDFTTQDIRVKPGMTANASIITDTAQDTLAVPSSAVKTQNGSSFVQVFEPPLPDAGTTGGVTSKKSPVSIPVTTGISDDSNVQILSGLTQNQQIIVRVTTGATAATNSTTRAGTGTGGNAGFRGSGVGGVRIGG